MKNLSKRIKKINEAVDPSKFYVLSDALTLAKQNSTAKFDESIDIAVNLGIDAKKSDQLVRGAVVLPKGTGKTVRVAVFAQADKAEEAKEAGADIVGFEDLAEQVKAGSMDFDVVIATPDAMRVVGQLGQILGPRGLMPNPKLGTVSADITKAVKDIKTGLIEIRNDKDGNLAATIGRKTFTTEKLLENYNHFIESVKKEKPDTIKGEFIKSIYLTSTMGISYKVGAK